MPNIDVEVKLLFEALFPIYFLEHRPTFNDTFNIYLFATGSPSTIPPPPRYYDKHKARPHKQQCRGNIVECCKANSYYSFDKVETD